MQQGYAMTSIKEKVAALRLSDAGSARGHARQFGWNDALDAVMKLLEDQENNKAEVLAQLQANLDRQVMIKNILHRAKPPYVDGLFLEAWREGVAFGVAEALIDEGKRIALYFLRHHGLIEQARAEDQQRILHLEYAVDRYIDGIREHRNARGDDRCWRDDETLYRLLPEGYTAPERDSAVELEQCQRFIACRQNPATEYISPERLIEQLKTERDAAIQDHGKESGFWGRMSARLVAERNAARREVERLTVLCSRWRP
jgi:hypothetical protein